jgi:hypothetical protein
MHYSSGPGVIPHPLPEVNFLMVEIPTPNKNYVDGPKTKSVIALTKIG